MSSPQQRLSSITNQVSGSVAARQQLLSKNPDDVVGKRRYGDFHLRLELINC